MELKKKVAAFLADAPLYQKRTFEMPPYFSRLEPEVVELHCSACGASRPFRDRRPRGSGGPGPLPALKSTTYLFALTCTGCEAQTALIWVECNLEGSWLRKVGQNPPWSIEVSSALARELGEDDTDLLKKARVCLSQSYGIGACAYMRRVLEDQVNPILDLIAGAITAAGEDASEVHAARSGKAFDTKLEIAYRHAPASLVVEGVNPLKLIHDRLSGGVHNLTDDEASVVASELVEALEFVVVELSRQRDARSVFGKAVRALARPKSQGSEGS